MLPQSPVERLSHFFLQYKPIMYRKRELVLHANDTPQGVYYIRRGFVRFYSISSDGEELTFMVFQKLDFFPVRWAVTGQAMTYYYETMTPTQLHLAPRGEFLSFLKKNPDVVFYLMENMLIRLRNIYERMEYMAYGHASAKVALMLVICSERYGVKEEGGVRIQVPLTHKDIASLVSVTRETVSVEMETLAKQGVIEHRSRYIFVPDIKKLQEASHLTT